MKRIIKDFKNFQYLKENSEILSNNELSNTQIQNTVDDNMEDEMEEEESPIDELAKELGVEKQKDERGDFIEFNGYRIVYYSENGYNITKDNKKVSKENIEDALDFLNNDLPDSIVKNRGLGAINPSITERKQHKDCSKCSPRCNCRTKR